MSWGRPTLLAGLALAANAVAQAADGVPAADDPMRLDLPALGPGSGEAPSPATLHIFGSLYLAAELEQAGVVPVAELLAAERDTLNLPSYEAAAKLDDFAMRGHLWYDRAGRVQLYARLFGVGPGATNDAGALVNREFLPLLAALCHALARYADVSARLRTSVGLEPGARLAAQALLANLAPRGLGNTLLAARRIEDQVRRAVDLVRDPAIGALVGSRTLQQTILNILGQEAPDVQRLIDSGLLGQKVLEWLAGVLPRIDGDPSHAPLVTVGDPIVVTAALWLRAVGIGSDIGEAA